MLYNFLIRYPFSQRAKQFIKSKNIDILSIDENIIKKAASLILKTINLSFVDQKKQWHNYLKINDKRIAELFVEIYPISKIILSIIDYAQLKQQFAVYYQRQLKYYLDNTLENTEFEDIMMDLCPSINYIDKDVRHYYIPLIDFLNMDLGNDYKLQYSNLDNGNLYFNRKELIEFLSIVLKKKILKTIDVDIKTLPNILLDYAKSIKSEILKDDKFKIKSVYRPAVGEYPPCFQEMYNNLLSGKKLTHIGNFALAVFLSNIGYKFDEILEVFKHAPNYNDKIASYQISKILEKKYSVSNCNTMKINNLCVKECKVKHPFQLLKNKENKNVKKDE